MTRSTTSRKQKNLLTAAAALFWLAVWQILSLCLPDLLASPYVVLWRLGSLALTAGFWSSAGFSLGRIFLGFLLALVLGTALAALSVKSPVARALTMPVAALMNTTPVASITILFLVFISSRNLSVLISAVMAFPVIYNGVCTGLNSRDPKLAEIARVYRLSTVRRLRYVTVSQVLPFLTPAVRVSLGLCWKAGISAEVIGIPTGSIGERLYMAKLFFNMPDLLAWTAAIILISVLLQRLLGEGLRVLERGAYTVRPAKEPSQPAPSEAAPARLRGVTVAYAGLQNVDMEFPAGEMSAVMGASGSGKTTLLNCLLGLVQPDGGQVEAAHIAAAVFQEDRLLPNLSAVSNIALLCPHRTRTEVLSGLRALGLENDADKPAVQLSGGMKRRVSLIAALLSDGELLVLDEPLEGLDAGTRESAINFIRKTRENRTAVLVTHTKTDAEALCKNIFCLPP